MDTTEMIDPVTGRSSISSKDRLGASQLGASQLGPRVGFMCPVLGPRNGEPHPAMWESRDLRRRTLHHFLSVTRSSTPEDRTARMKLNPFRRPTTTTEPLTPEQWRQRSRRRYLIGGGALAAASLLGGVFTAGWYVANLTAPASPTPDVIEVPILDPLAGDILMPDLRGMAEADALQVIADAGIPVASVIVESRPAAGSPDVVIEQTPAFGTEDPGQVTVIISEPAAVPDIVGKKASDASAELIILGAAVATEDGYDPGKDVGVILNVSPGPGEPLPAEVAVTVNAPPSSISLTDVDTVTQDCNIDENVLIVGDQYSTAIICDADTREGVTEWLLAGAADRITGTIGIPDDEPVGSIATAIIRLDGKEAARFALQWGSSERFDIPASGALKLEITVTGEDTTAAFGDVLLLGNAQSIAKIRER